MRHGRELAPLGSCQCATERPRSEALMGNDGDEQALPHAAADAEDEAFDERVQR